MKVETGTVRFPVCRTKVKAIQKDSFTQCGKATTFQGTYSIAASEAPEDWKERFREDQPLFWQESKPICFWQTVLDEFLAGAVFMTAGSGALSAKASCITDYA